MSSIAQAALQDQVARASKRHFEMLDGIRGVAAMGVLLFHSYKGGGIFPNGPLAVDLFFMLSGFVIAYSYGDRLAGGLSPLAFMRLRLIRLYPMILVGALGGLGIALLHNKTNPAQAYPLHSVLSSGALSLLVVPYLVKAGLGIAIFSFNPPIWSLFFELIGNLFYAVIIKWLRPWVLVAIIVAGLVGVGLGGELGGGAQDNFWLGFPRFAAGFFGGVLLYRLWSTSRLPPLRANFAVVAIFLLTLFAFPHVIGGWLFAPVFVAFAGMIAMAANAGPSRLDRVYALMGQTSYPLYLTHWLTLYVLTFIGTKLGLVGPKYAVVAAALVVVGPVVGYLFYRYYETPVLRLLKPNKRPPLRLDPVADSRAA